MAKKNIYYKLLLSLVAILVILALVRVIMFPEKEDEVTEQVEEIEWEDIDKIEFRGKNTINIQKASEGFEIIMDDSVYKIPAAKVREMFSAFNKFQYAERKPVDFEQWSTKQNDSLAIVLKLYENTEEILNLYILPGDKSTYFRYFDSNDLYKTDKINDEAYNWLDSLANN